jgi:hypothetical protein
MGSREAPSAKPESNLPPPIAAEGNIKSGIDERRRLG